MPQQSLDMSADMSIYKLIVSSKLLVVSIVSIRPRNTIALCRPGADSWLVSGLGNKRMLFDMVFSGGKLYVVDEDKDLLAIEIEEDSDSGKLRISQIKRLIEEHRSSSLSCTAPRGTNNAPLLSPSRSNIYSTRPRHRWPLLALPLSCVDPAALGPPVHAWARSWEEGGRIRAGLAGSRNRACRWDDGGSRSMLSSGAVVARSLGELGGDGDDVDDEFGLGDGFRWLGSAVSVQAREENCREQLE
ncbi:hypothetical protein EJB05_12644 [Eragrostis curvula]|uniref:KIB1-4 beta-propeller domain-containing protein n=1 Tax=Eragrostis curvula TaxID=38414 RepID=A0A5J9VUH5_9POAL|nr:hypothetical protein EJB05_12644 [Eragrostis curvula]